jgi:hypothetical protein
MPARRYTLDRKSAARIARTVKAHERTPRSETMAPWAHQARAKAGASSALIRGTVRANPFIYGIPPGEWGTVDRGEVEYYTFNPYERAWCPPGVTAQIQWIAADSRYELVGWECGQSQCPELEPVE